MDETGTKRAIDRLQGQHSSLDRLAVRVGKLMKEGSLAEVLEVWTELESAVRRHLAAEEGALLPDFSQYDLAEAQEIEVQHDELREQFRQCRQALERRDFDRDLLLSALNAYRAHQVHEDTTLYRWASARDAR